MYTCNYVLYIHAGGGSLVFAFSQAVNDKRTPTSWPCMQRLGGGEVGLEERELREDVAINRGRINRGRT